MGTYDAAVTDYASAVFVGFGAISGIWYMISRSIAIECAV